MRYELGWHALALPDTDRAGGAAALADAPVLARHTSGRPWLLSTYPGAQVCMVTNGDDRIAVLGFSDVDEQLLHRVIGRADVPKALDELAGSASGSFIIAASLSGCCRMQGGALGGTRVFHTRVAGCVVLADRADVLADLAGSKCDPVALAVRMMRRVPHPLAELSLWDGVDPVEPGHHATVDRTGARCLTAPWWRRPDPVLSRAEGATRLAAALERAVYARTSAANTVYADLSGGFDSTPQAWFAARGPARLITGTGWNRDPGGGEDLFWARRALETMPSVEHTVYSTDEMPDFYGGLDRITDRLDEPSDAYRAAPGLLFSMDRASKCGASVYLHGLGGDDLLVGHPRYEHSLFRRRPLLALRRLRQYQLLEHMSFSDSFGGLFDSRDYRRWLLDTICAADESPERATPRLTMDWDHTVSWPRWFGGTLRKTIRERVLDIADSAVPLGPDIVGHGQIVALRESQRIIRAAAQLGAARGLAFQAPVSDDRVAEAIFSVRPEERFTPKEFKPLMREAMRGRLSDTFLERSRKNSGAPRAVRGLRDHGAAVLDLCLQSPLPDLGIVDPSALSQYALPGPRWNAVRDIDTTINGALFARSHQEHCTVKETAA